MPPAYTFVGDGEPFHSETVEYFNKLRLCGIPATVDVYRSDMHAFDMMKPEEKLSKEAVQRFNEQFEYARQHYFAPQKQK